MAVTIHVNGKTNSLVHKGSMGIAKSTIPDVCKTPSPGGPVPIPYPIIVSMSSDLKKGTKTVKVDGKKMAAVKGSEFSRCTGDEPGTAGGGVKSSTNMKEATWLLYSFDVKMDGKNACRLSDKMMMNHGNTACLGGEMQIPVVLTFDQAKGLLCQIFCECKVEAQARKYETLTDPAAFDAPDFGADARGPGRAMNQACVERKLNQDYKNTNLIAEQSYDMNTKPPSPVPGRPSGSRRPDIVRTKGPGPARAPNIDVFEMKFPGDSYGEGQEEAYERIGGGQPVTTLDSEECGC